MNLSLKIIIMCSVIVFLVVAGITYYQKSIPNINLPQTTPTSTTPESSPSANISPNISPAPSKQQVKIFMIALSDDGKSGKKVGCGDSVLPVTREISSTSGILKSTLEDLLSIKNQYFGESGLYNALYQSNLKVDNVVIEEGMATIQLSGTTALGGVCDSPRFESQLMETALQFDTVKNVSIFINKTRLQQVLSGKGN